MNKIKAGGANAIGVLSGKGGVGKTTIVANLGAALASEFKQKVLVIDGNVKTSHLGLHLGLYEDLPVTLKEVLLKKVPVIYAIYLHPTIGLRLLPAPMKGDMDLKKMDGIIKGLKTAYNPILVDCAPGLGRDVILAAKAIDEAILVTTPDLPAVTDGMKTISLLEKLKKGIIGIVLNRVRGVSYELSVEEVESACGYDVISVIPETDKIPESVAEGMPLVMDSDCPASVELKRLAGSLIGEEYQPTGIWYGLQYKLKHLFGGHLFNVDGVALRKPGAPRKPKAAFLREAGTGGEEYDGIEGAGAKEKGRLIKEGVEEELIATDELRMGLKGGLRKDLETGKRLKRDVHTADLEEEVMERIKEKLRERTGK